MMIILWQEWVDDNLTWDFRKYRGRFVRLRPTDIWIPDIIFVNSINRFEHLKEVSILPIRLVVIINWFRILSLAAVMFCFEYNR